MTTKTIPLGHCFSYANQLIQEMVNDDVIPEKNIIVCHALIVEPCAKNQKRFPHAWIEANGRCYDWQRKIAGIGSLPKEDFYELFKPTSIKKYNYTQVLVNILKFKHHGPWE